MTRDRSGSAEKYHRTVDQEGGGVHARALALTGEGRRVLELGCATGHVTAALKSRGHHVVGVEVDPVSAERARQVADEVLVADLDATDLLAVVGDRRFDVALMGDVLEHLRDPGSVLREVVDVLDVGGYAVISVPNVAFIDTRTALLDGLWEYRDDGLLDATHLRFFTRRSLFELVRSAGLVVTDFQPVVWPVGMSNVQPPQRLLGPFVSDLVTLDPNAHTYVFVVKAERADASANAKAHALESEIIERERVAREQIAARLGDRASLEARATAAEAELVAIRSTKLFRWSALPRRAYARLRNPSRR